MDSLLGKTAKQGWAVTHTTVYRLPRAAPFKRFGKMRMSAVGRAASLGAGAKFATLVTGRLRHPSTWVISGTSLFGSVLNVLALLSGYSFEDAGRNLVFSQRLRE